MATCTVVYTYTPDGGPGSNVRLAVTSLTVDGTAFASLTAAQVNKAIILGELARKPLQAGGSAVLPPPSGRKNTDITS